MSDFDPSQRGSDAEWMCVDPALGPEPSEKGQLAANSSPQGWSDVTMDPATGLPPAEMGPAIQPPLFSDGLTGHLEALEAQYKKNAPIQKASAASVPFLPGAPPQLNQTLSNSLEPGAGSGSERSLNLQAKNGMVGGSASTAARYHGPDSERASTTHAVGHDLLGNTTYTGSLSDTTQQGQKRDRSVQVGRTKNGGEIFQLAGSNVDQQGRGWGGSARLKDGVGRLGVNRKRGPNSDIGGHGEAKVGTNGQLQQVGGMLKASRGGIGGAGQVQKKMNAMGEAQANDDGSYMVNVDNSTGYDVAANRQLPKTGRALNAGAGRTEGRSERRKFADKKEADAFRNNKAPPKPLDLANTAEWQTNEGYTDFETTALNGSGSVPLGPIRIGGGVHTSTTESTDFMKTEDGGIEINHNVADSTGWNANASAGIAGMGFGSDSTEYEGEINEVADPSSDEGKAALAYMKANDNQPPPPWHPASKGMRKVGQRKGSVEQDTANIAVGPLSASTSNKQTHDVTTRNGDRFETDAGEEQTNVSLLWGPTHETSSSVTAVQKNNGVANYQFKNVVNSSSSEDANDGLSRLLGTDRDVDAGDRDTKGRKVSVTSELNGDAVNDYMDEFANGTIGKDVYLTGNSKADEHLLDFKNTLEALKAMEATGVGPEIIEDQRRSALAKLSAEGGPRAMQHVQGNVAGPKNQDIHVAGDKRLNGSKWRHDNDDQAARLDAAIEDPDANMADAGAELAQSMKAADARVAAFTGEKGAKNYPELPRELRRNEKAKARNQRRRLRRLEKRRKKADAENAKQDKILVDAVMDGNDPLKHQPETAQVGPVRADFVSEELSTDQILEMNDQDDEYEAAHPKEEPARQTTVRRLGSR